jgi:hypothetical protein
LPLEQRLSTRIQRAYQAAANAVLGRATRHETGGLSVDARPAGASVAQQDPAESGTRPEDLDGTFVSVTTSRDLTLAGRFYQQSLRRVGPALEFTEPRGVLAVDSFAFVSGELAEQIFDELAGTLFGDFLHSPPAPDDEAGTLAGEDERSLPFDTLERLAVGSRAIGARTWSDKPSDTGVRLVLFQRGPVVGAVALYSFESPAQLDEAVRLARLMDARVGGSDKQP